MAIAPLSQLSDYELVNKKQDVRGWQVVDEGGTIVGVVRELIIDTEAERVSQLVLDSGREVAVHDVILGDKTVRLGRAAAGPAPVPSRAQVPGQEGVATLETEETVRLPVMEQELRVGKREVLRGGVRISTKVEEHPVEEQVKLREEQVVVERRPMDLPVSDQFIDHLPKTPISVVAAAEVPVVDKVARVLEEVHVRKDIEERVETVRDSVRHTDVNVERLPPSTSARRG